MAADIAKAKRNVKRMVDAGAPEEDIDAYLSDAGLTPEAIRAAPSAPGLGDQIMGGLRQNYNDFMAPVREADAGLKSTVDHVIGDRLRKLVKGDFSGTAGPGQYQGAVDLKDAADLGSAALGYISAPLNAPISAMVKPFTRRAGSAIYKAGLAPKNLSEQEVQKKTDEITGIVGGLASMAIGNEAGGARSSAALQRAAMGKLDRMARPSSRAPIPEPVAPPEDIFPGDMPSKLPVTETPSVSAPVGQTQKVRRFNGLDHPVEVTGPAVKDAQTGKDYVPVVSQETGATGHVPADEVFDVPVAPEAPAAGPSAGPSAGPQARTRSAFVPGRALRSTSADRAALQARQMALRDLTGASRGGVDITAPAPEFPMMAAEQLGQGARSRLGAAADLSESAATSLTNKLQERISGTQDFAMRGFERELGVTPEEAMKGVDDTIAGMQQRAKPLYEERVRGNEQPQQSPILERMAAENPYFQQAQRDAMKQLRGQDRPAHVESTQVRIPEERATGGGRSSSQYMGDVLEVIRGGARRANRADGENLNEFIAARGGLQDVGGDLQAMNANDNTFNRGLGKLGKMIRPTGSSLHDAAVAAWEGGFFREVPTERELLDAIDQGLRGRPVRSMHSAQEGAARAEYLRQLEERIGTLDIQGGASPRQIAEALANDDASTDALTALGETGGVYPGTIGETETVQAPRLELMDMVKRNLDAMEKKAVEKGNSLDTIPIEATRSSLLEELDKLNPDYANIRKIGGEAPRVKAIYTQTRDYVFNNARSNAEFDKWLGDKTAEEAKAAIARLADDLTTVVGGRTAGALPGNVNLVKYTTPNFRYRLRRLAQRADPKGGAKQAQRFSDYIDALNKSRTSAMDLLPRSNSKTARLQAAAKGLRDDMGEVDLSRLPKSKADLLSLAAKPFVEAASKAISNVKIGGLRNIAGNFTNNDVLAEYERLMSLPLPEMLAEVRSTSPAIARRVDKLVESYGGKVKAKGAKP